MQDFGSKSTPREPETHRISVGGGVCGLVCGAPRFIDTPNKTINAAGCWVVGCAVQRGGLSRGARARRPRGRGSRVYNRLHRGGLVQCSGGRQGLEEGL